MQEETQLDVLRDIRELLIPITAHYRPEYEEQVRREHRERAASLAQLVRGAQARRACRLMDGSNDQAAIRLATGIASGNLSTMISRLEEAGMLSRGSGRRRPALIFQPWELDEIFGGAE